MRYFRVEALCSSRALETKEPPGRKAREKDDIGVVRHAVFRPHGGHSGGTVKKLRAEVFKTLSLAKYA